MCIHTDRSTYICKASLCIMWGPNANSMHYCKSFCHSLNSLTPSETSFSISLYNLFLRSPRVVLDIYYGVQGLFLCSIGKFNYIELILMDCHYIRTYYYYYIGLHMLLKFIHNYTFLVRNYQ